LRFLSRIPSAYAGRAVPSGGCRPPGPSRCGVWCGSRHPSRVPRRPCGFRASRPVSVASIGLSRSVGAPRAFLVAAGTPPVRVIRAWCSSDSARSGPAPGLFSRPGRRRFRAPGDARGVCLDPSQCCPDPRVSAPRRRARAHLPFRLVARPASFIVAVPLFRADGGPVRPRLLGFGPGGQSWPRIGRPRYSFCAEGRVGRWLVTALGFSCTGRGTPRRTLVDLRFPAGVPVRHEPLLTGS